MTITRTVTLLATISILSAGARPGTQASSAKADESAAARTIKSDVAQLIAGINAHDVRRATAFDAPNIVSMECGRPSTTTLAAEQAGHGEAFSHNPDWRVRAIDDTVDVAKAGDMAVYRGTYYQDSTHAGSPTTQIVNFVVGFTRQADGSWKVAWSVVAPIEAMHAR
jgi:ketosteroid isomerase-like protein